MLTTAAGGDRLARVTTFLSVQHAARRLGVSPVTIRRWTSTGFLPCTRTAGGHRRIAADDIEELARAIGGSTHLAARRARERELDTLVETSIALATQLDLQPLLAEIARRMTHLLDCDFCAVSTYDAETRLVRTLAEYDATGARLPDTGTYDVRQFPLTRKVLDEQAPEVVNVDDLHADAAEVAMLRAGGDRSLLMLPLVYQGRSIGLLEATDAGRARKYTRQELRLCAAVAGQAAVALHNASMLAESRSCTKDLVALGEALRGIAPGLGEALAEPDPGALLERLARSVCDALDALSCVAASGTLTAGASLRDSPSTAADPAGPRPAAQRSGTQAGHILTGGDPAGRVSLTVALPRRPSEGVAELVDLVATLAAGGLAGSRTGPPSPTAPTQPAQSA
jgi:excisionase family DNA binding protein